MLIDYQNDACTSIFTRYLFDFLAIYQGVENFITLLYHDIPNLVI